MGCQGVRGTRKLCRAQQRSIEFISIQSWPTTGEDEAGMREDTADVPHQIADANLPEAAAVFDAATALDTAIPAKKTG